MAYTTVVNSSFFEDQMVPALKALDADPAIGPLSFAMLVPAKFVDGYRSLVLASAKMDTMGRREAIGTVFDVIDTQKILDRRQIDTVSVLRTNDIGIRMLSEAFHIDSIGAAHLGTGHAVDALDLENPILFLSRHLPQAA